MKLVQAISLLVGTLWLSCEQPDNGAAAEAPVVPNPAEAEVQAAHDAYYRTLVDEGPDFALERYYAEEYTYIGVDGKLIDRDGLKARMQRNRLGHFSLEDALRRITVYGDVAVLSGHSTSRITDRGREKRTADGYTEVWVLREGRWLLVAEQITPQPTPVPAQQGPLIH